MSESNDIGADAAEFIAQHDLQHERPPACWQDGILLGNGNLGAVFYAPQALEWLINKTDVIDARTRGVRRVIPRNEADRMVAAGACAADFEREEHGDPGPEGIGPKSCCSLTMDLGMTAGAGTRGALPGIRSRLSLYDATLRLALDKHLCHPRVESFVRADENMLVIGVRDVSPLVSHQTRIFFSRPEDIELDTPELWLEDDHLMMRMNMPEGVTYVVGLAAATKASTAFRNDVLPHIREKYRPPVKGTVHASIRGRFGQLNIGGDFDLFLTVATTHDSKDPAATVRARLNDALSVEYTALREPHAAWWREFWARSRVELDNRELERLFYRSLYALGCSYRKAPISGLVGLVYGPSVGPLQITPWTGDYHHDLNVQCPFFPVHVLNHSDLFDAYLDTYHAFLPEAQRLAREIWGVNGAHFDMCFNAMGKSILGGVGTYRYFFGGSYVALMHCLSWRYCRDKNRLRDRIYPFLREIIEFYRNMMTKGADGSYHLSPAHACELDVMANGDPVQTISMLKVCLQTAIEGAHVLAEQNQTLVDGWRDLLANLPEYPRGVDQKGREVIVDGDGIPADHHVGQAGCLHPVYPCGEVDEFSDIESLARYNRTLDSVVDKTAQISYADQNGYHYQCVWQCFFRAMTALRLGRTEEFRDRYLPMFLRAYVKPNGLVSHDAVVIAPPAKTEANLANIPDETLLDVGEKMPKFEPWCGHGGGATPNAEAKNLSVALIEGSADYLTMIAESLLQSHNGIIRIFPAWEGNACFTGLVAEGNVSVSACRRDGRVQYVRLKPLPGGVTQIKLKSPWTGKVAEFRLPDKGEMALTEQ